MIGARMRRAASGLLAPAPGDYDVEVLADEPVGYWRLGEASGTTAVDETTTYSGTYVGTYTLGADGIVDTALSLSGVDQSGVSMPAAITPATGDFTFECWVYIHTAQTNPMWANYYDTVGDRFAIFLRNTNRVSVQVGGSAADFAATVATGTWHHIVVTRDGSSWGLYLDGEFIETKTASATLDQQNATIGYYSESTAAEALDGRLHKAAMFHSVLSAERVAAHYAHHLLRT